jgi:hypothetical protein
MLLRTCLFLMKQTGAIRKMHNGKQYNGKTMDNLIAWGLTTLVGAFVGSYLAGYLKKKAENLATHEDFEKLLAEQKTTIEATKVIEARISIDAWSQQQRWDVQKAALLESLKELATAEAFLFRLVHAFSETKDRPECWDERRKEANEKYADAINNFWRTQLAMEIVCGKAIGNQFQGINHLFTRVLNKARQGDFSDIWDKQHPEILAAKRELGETIRMQLEFDPHLGGGELDLSSNVISQPNVS